MTRFFLGIEISRSPAGTLLNQRKYTLDILKDVGLTGAKPATFPLPKGLKLSTEIGEVMSNPEAYSRIIGRPLYLTITIPNIFYVVQHLSQFLQQPGVPHYQAALHVMRYLIGTTNRGLYYSSNNNFQLLSHCDAD